MTYRFMVSEVRDWVYRYWIMVAWQIHQWQTHGPLFQLILGFQRGFHCVILDLKDLPSHLFWRIVTFNNWQSYCLDSSWTLTFLTNLTCPPVFPHQGRKYMSKRWIWKTQRIELFHGNTCLRYPSYPSQGYPSDANSNKETKKVWTLHPSQA